MAAGAVLIFLSLFCFNYFLRGVAAGANGPAGAVDSLMLVLALLLGCSVGAGLHMHHLPWKLPALIVLALGWVGLLVWHVQRIDQARKRIEESLLNIRQAGGRMLLTPHGVPPALFGVRRVLDRCRNNGTFLSRVPSRAPDGQREGISTLDERVGCYCSVDFSPRGLAAWAKAHATADSRTVI